MLRFMIFARPPQNTVTEYVKTPVAGTVKGTIKLPVLKAKLILPKLKAKVKIV